MSGSAAWKPRHLRDVPGGPAARTPSLDGFVRDATGQHLSPQDRERLAAALLHAEEAFDEQVRERSAELKAANQRLAAAIVDYRRAVERLKEMQGGHYHAARLLDAAGVLPAAPETPIAFVQATDAHPQGCLLLDLRMPVIVVTTQGDTARAMAAMKAGAADGAERPFGAEIPVGQPMAAPRQSVKIDRARASAEAAQRLAELSVRERQVLDGLVAGRPNKTIAGNLGISVRTVEVHRARMLRRLGTRQLADAIRLAVIASLPAADREPPRA